MQSVFADLGIWERIGQYQAGETGSDFWNGDVAAAEGHLSLMVSKHVQGDPLSYTHLGMRSAAANGRTEVVRWLHDYTDVAQMPSAMDAAAAGGHLEVCMYFSLDLVPVTGLLYTASWIGKRAYRSSSQWTFPLVYACLRGDYVNCVCNSVVAPVFIITCLVREKDQNWSLARVSETRTCAREPLGICIFINSPVDSPQQSTCLLLAWDDVHYR